MSTDSIEERRDVRNGHGIGSGNAIPVNLETAVNLTRANEGNEVEVSWEFLRRGDESPGG